MWKLKNGDYMTQDEKVMIRRFESSNQVKISLGKLAKWKKIKDVVSFNEVFQKFYRIFPILLSKNNGIDMQEVSNHLSRKSFAIKNASH